MQILPGVLLRWVFSFWVDPSTSSLCCVLVLVVVFDFCFQVTMWLPCSPMGGSIIGVCNAATLCSIPLIDMFLLVMVHGPHQECTEWLLLSLLQVGGASCYLFNCPWAIPSIWLGIQIQQSHPIHLPSPHGRAGVPYPGLIPSSDMIHCESVVGITPGDSGVVIGY